MTKDEEIEVCVTVYNNSDVPGKETVMLYLQDVVASTARPVQQLVAFNKFSFDARERKTVKFTIKEEMMKFWNNENQFVSEAGEFKISTGYADHLVLTKSIILQ